MANFDDFPGELFALRELGARTYQEDVVICDVGADGSFVCGVADGHGGQHTAAFLKARYGGLLLARVGAAFAGAPASASLAEVALVVADAHVEVEQAMVAEGVGAATGATLCVCLYLGPARKAFIVNVGDSGALVWNDAGGGRMFRTEAHTPESERAHVERSGGYVTARSPWEPARINGVLSVGRAFGDLNLGGDPSRPAVVSCAPTVSEVDASPGARYYLATDGVWDFVGPYEPGAGPAGETRRECVERVHSMFKAADNSTSVSFSIGGAPGS